MRKSNFSSVKDNSEIKKRAEKAMETIIKPNKKAKKAMKDEGITIYFHQEW